MDDMGGGPMHDHASPALLARPPAAQGIKLAKEVAEEMAAMHGQACFLHSLPRLVLRRHRHGFVTRAHQRITTRFPVNKQCAQLSGFHTQRQAAKADTGCRKRCRCGCRH